MITGLRGATIWSEDLNNLLPFYRDVLGLPVGVQTPGFVVLGTREGPALALGTHSDAHGRADDRRYHDGLQAVEGRGRRVRRGRNALWQRMGRDSERSRRELRPAPAVRSPALNRSGESP